MRAVTTIVSTSILSQLFLNNAHEALALKEFFDVACRRGSPPRLEIPLDARPKKSKQEEFEHI